MCCQCPRESRPKEGRGIAHTCVGHVIRRYFGTIGYSDLPGRWSTRDGTTRDTANEDDSSFAVLTSDM